MTDETLYEQCNDLAQQVTSLIEQRDHAIRLLGQVTRSIENFALQQYAVIAEEKDADGKFRYTNEKRREHAVQQILAVSDVYAELSEEQRQTEIEKRVLDRKIDLLQDLLKNAQLERRRRGRDAQIVILREANT